MEEPSLIHTISEWAGIIYAIIPTYSLLQETNLKHPQKVPATWIHPKRKTFSLEVIGSILKLVFLFGSLSCSSRKSAFLQQSVNNLWQQLRIQDNNLSLYGYMTFRILRKHHKSSVGSLPWKRWLSNIVSGKESATDRRHLPFSEPGGSGCLLTVLSLMGVL